MGNEEIVNQIQVNKDMSAAIGDTECPWDGPQDAMLPLAEIRLS